MYGIKKWGLPTFKDSGGIKIDLTLPTNQALLDLFGNNFQKHLNKQMKVTEEFSRYYTYLANSTWPHITAPSLAQSHRSGFQVPWAFSSA